jgi:hypothetical protein
MADNKYEHLDMQVRVTDPKDSSWSASHVGETYHVMGRCDGTYVLDDGVRLLKEGEFEVVDNS